MARKRVASLKKPQLTPSQVLSFAEGAAKRRAPAASKSGLVPTGDVRLTVNMRQDLHLRLKIKAAEERTTIGELVERWVESWKH